MSAPLEPGELVVIMSDDGTTVVATVERTLTPTYLVRCEGQSESWRFGAPTLQSIAARDRATISPTWGRA